MIQWLGTVQELLPHAPPMVLVDKVVEWSLEGIHTQVTIGEASLFLDEKGVPSYVGLEYMAQTAGAWSGMHSLKAGCLPQRGYLLGSRQLSLEVPYFEKGWCLDIYAQVDFIDETIGSFKSWICHHSKTVVRANITVYRPKDESVKNELLSEGAEFYKELRIVNEVSAKRK